jgi:hypothetical protein
MLPSMPPKTATQLLKELEWFLHKGCWCKTLHLDEDNPAAPFIEDLRQYLTTQSNVENTQPIGTERIA